MPVNKPESLPAGSGLETTTNPLACGLWGTLVLPAATAKDFLAWLTALVSFGLLLGSEILGSIWSRSCSWVTHDTWRFLQFWFQILQDLDRFGRENPWFIWFQAVPSISPGHAPCCSRCSRHPRRSWKHTTRTMPRRCFPDRWGVPRVEGIPKWIVCKGESS